MNSICTKADILCSCCQQKFHLTTLVVSLYKGTACWTQTSPLCGSKLNVHPGFLNLTSVTVIFWIPALFGIKFWTDDKYLELNFDLQQPGGREKPSSDEWLEWTLNLWVWISSIFKPRNVSSASSVKSTCHPQPLSWYPNICRQTAGTAAGPPGTQPWRLLRGSFCQLFLALFLTSKTHSKSRASTKEPLLFLLVLKASNLTDHICC